MRSLGSLALLIAGVKGARSPRKQASSGKSSATGLNWGSGEGLDDPDDTSAIHCGKLQIQTEEKIASRVWPVQDSAILNNTGLNCVNGMAGEYPCHNVDLLSYIPLSSVEVFQSLASTEGNDIWGWTDPDTNKEYAIMGVRYGTAFIDISDPGDAKVVGNVVTATIGSDWHDIKVFGNRAYIVSEAKDHGMQVFDLTRLRGRTSYPGSPDEADYWYQGFGNAHNMVINEESGKGYAVGSGYCSGGLYIMDLTQPEPRYLGCFSADGYTHDAQCVIYRGPDSEHAGKEICVAYNQNSVTVVDIGDGSSPSMLSRVSYDGFKYTHQGWFDAEQTYLYVDDEMDEDSSAPNTKTFIFDASDLDDVKFVSRHDSEQTAIDHNLYTLNGYIYQANYCAGLRILKIQADKSISEIAYFDVAPDCSSPTMAGAWSVYPYYASGVIAVSSIERGFFLLRADLEGPPPEPTPAPPQDDCPALCNSLLCWFPSCGSNCDYC